MGTKYIHIFFIIFSLGIVLNFCSKKTTTPDEQLSAPSNLQITQVGENQIKLTWQDNSINETKFFIDRKEGEFDWYGNYGEVEANITTFPDNIPTNSDTVYSYKVRAFDGEDYSEYSTPAGWFSEIATPTNLLLEQIAQDSIKLTWNDNSIGEFNFHVDRKIGSENWQENYKILGPDTTIYIDYNSSLYDTCYYRVSAVCGNSHSKYSQNNFIPFLPAPSDLAIEALSATSIKITWQDNCEREDGYLVYKRFEETDWNIINIPANTEEWTDEDVIPGIINYYKVCAFIGDDRSGYIEDNLNTLPAPSNFQIEQLNVTTFKLTWQDNSNFEQGFKIDRKIDDEEWINEIEIVDSNITEWIDDTLGDDYEIVYYRVYAYYGEYNSKKILKRFGLIAPTNLTLQKPDNDKIEISWEDNSYGEEGFYIDKKIGGLDWIIDYAFVDSNVTSMIDDIPQPCGTFYYRVRAFCDTYYSGYSNEEHINIRLEQVDSLNTLGDANEVFVSNSGWYAFVADGYNGLVIIDCINPTLPNEITTMNLPDRTLSVFVQDNLAYVTNHNGGFNLVNISIINSPEVVGDCVTAGVPNDVFVYGDHAYVADGAAGISIIFTSEPPHFITNISTNGDARKVFIKENYDYAFVANGLNGGIAIFDISEPTNPITLSNLQINGLSQDVFVLGNYAYLANGECGLEIINITDINNPYLVSNCTTEGFAYSVYAQGNYVYLADKEKGLLVIDISNPSSPFILLVFEMTTEPVSIYISGSYAFLADNEGLKIVQIAP